MAIQSFSRVSALVVLALVGPLASAASAAIVKASADAQLNEQATTETSSSNSGLGVGTAINARYNPAGGNNELIVLKFDLTGYTMSAISGASLNLISQRANGVGRTDRLYGVIDGSLGNDNAGTTAGFDDNTWSETAVRFSTMPGLNWDGNNTSTTANDFLDTAELVDLGTIVTTSTTAAEGGTVSFSSAALTSFLNAHPDSVVSFIFVQETVNTGQMRFASKEATALGAVGSPIVPAGTYAPYLSFTDNTVPEPTTLTAAAAVIGLAASRRRQVARI